MVSRLSAVSSGNDHLIGIGLRPVGRQNLFAVDRDDDAVADHNLLINFAAQDQHGESSVLLNQGSLGESIATQSRDPESTRALSCAANETGEMHPMYRT